MCFSRQIGIARILANEYGADFSSSNEEKEPLWCAFFNGCDSTEVCQSAIIQFIKEFKIDVHRQHCRTSLQLAVLHKLFTIVKFLVEDCKVDVNCAGMINGTPCTWLMGEHGTVSYRAWS